MGREATLSRGHRTSRRWAIVLMVATMAALGAFGAGALAASRNAKITATWSCCGAGGASPQTWVVKENGAGALSGTGLTATGSVFATITGRVSGRRVTLVTTYNSFDPGYVATFIGKVAILGRRMTGSWTSNQNQSGTWTAVRVRARSKKKKT
jgi:hypothetical protein